MYMRARTASTEKVAHRQNTTATATFWFGGSSKLGRTPTGGVPAGPFKRASTFAWSCADVEVAVGVAIVVTAEDQTGWSVSMSKTSLGRSVL